MSGDIIERLKTLNRTSLFYLSNTDSDSDYPSSSSDDESVLSKRPRVSAGDDGVRSSKNKNKKKTEKLGVGLPAGFLDPLPPKNAPTPAAATVVNASSKERSSAEHCKQFRRAGDYTDGSGGGDRDALPAMSRRHLPCCDRDSAPPQDAPTLPSPPVEPPVEQPQQAWQGRRLGYETEFPIEQFFAQEPFTAYSIQQIERYSLHQFCRVPWPVYPRLVRLFYQNLREVPHHLLHFETTIDGCNIFVSPSIVARAACLHAHQPPGLRLQEPLPPFHQLATDICTRRVHCGETYTLRRYVHSDDLLLDTIIWRNIYPHGNKQERRQVQLAPLYCAHHDLWFDYGQLICQSIDYFWNGAHRTKRAMSQRWLLPHAGLITAILTTATDPTINSRSQYVIRPAELRDPHREVYDPLTWTKTSAHLYASLSSSEAFDAAADDDDTPAPATASHLETHLALPPSPEPHIHADTPSTSYVPPPPPSLASPFQLTEEQYLALLQGQAQIQQTLAEILSRLTPVAGPSQDPTTSSSAPSAPPVDD